MASSSVLSMFEFALFVIDTIGLLLRVVKPEDFREFIKFMSGNAVDISSGRAAAGCFWATADAYKGLNCCKLFGF